MEENNKVTKLTQRDYQKKYDEKTQSVTIKYTPADMKDYDRMMKYLEKTGKSRSSFIKELINDFFEKEKYVMYEGKVAEYLSLYGIEDESLEKLKNVVGNNKFEVFVNFCKDITETEIIDTYTDRGCAFDDWIKDFLDDVESGDINIDVSDKEFERIIDKRIAFDMGSVYYN